MMMMQLRRTTQLRVITFQLYCLNDMCVYILLLFYIVSAFLCEINVYKMQTDVLCDLDLHVS